MSEQGRAPRPASQPPPRPAPGKAPSVRAPARPVTPPAGTPAPPLAKRATTLVSRPPPPPVPTAVPSVDDTKVDKAGPSVTGVVAKGEESPDDTVPQYMSRTTGVPVTPASQPKPQTPQTQSGQKIVTPLPSSSPFDRYSQTHIPIEVRERIRAIVREVVEEAMAPVQRWQKDVDAKLERLMRQGPASAPAPASPRGAVRDADPWSPLAAAPPSAGPATATAPLAATRAPQTLRNPGAPTDMELEALVQRDYVIPGGGRVEVPDELDGGRRKRAVSWVVGTLILVVLTAFLSAMAVSQMR